MDYKIYDLTTFFFSQIKEEEKGSYTVIIDIDEKSLQQLGQWPWARIIDAELIKTVNKMNPSAIGVNILFAEKDRHSPIAIQEFYKTFFNLNIPFSELSEELKDNDRILSQSIELSNATLSIHFNNSFYRPSYCNELSYQGNTFSSIKTDFHEVSFLCNHESIQRGVENFGFINAWPDSDGIFRRIPLFLNYEEEVFPSFALATLLSFDKDIEIDRENTTILVNFSQKKSKVFSAVDILNGDVELNEIQGKVVVIGSSLIGLNPTYNISNDKIFSNTMIHAFVMENILDKTFLIQPGIYKQISFLLSFLLSLLVIVLFSKKYYIHLFTLFFVTFSITFIGLVVFYINNIYISIGYLWIPLLYVFTFKLLYHIAVIYKEKHEQEKFLIRQSKLASMGEMISLIAHQWRQPLSAINGIVLTLDVDHRKKILDRDTLDKYLNEIEDTTAYLSNTINDFTDFFSKNKIREHFYIADVIKQVNQLVGSLNDKNIQIIYKKSENIEIMGYRSELLQSFLILLNNAIYACQKNLPNTGEGQIIIDTYKLKDDLIISMEDNGGGIDIKSLKKIFDPYFTTKEKAHGTGLGLYILKLLIEDSMNGRVSVSNGKEGAIFLIKIPINPSVKPKKWGFLMGLYHKIKAK